VKTAVAADMIILGPSTVKAWRALSYDAILEVVKTATFHRSH
jgi:hypothetical protein